MCPYTVGVQTIKQKAPGADKGVEMTLTATYEGFGKVGGKVAVTF